MRSRWVFTSLLSLLVILGTTVATAQTISGTQSQGEGGVLKQAIKSLTPLFSRAAPNVYTIDTRPDLQQHLAGVLSGPMSASAATALRRQGFTFDAAEALVLDSSAGQAFAIPLRNAAGQYITSSNAETTFSLMFLTPQGLVLTVEGAVDQATGETSRITFRDPASRDGLEFNYHDAKVYQLGGTVPSPRATTGTVACVLQALGDLAKPCEAFLLGANIGACIAAIAALPVTAGVSAIVALPACLGVIGDLLKAVVCAGVDCGLGSVCTAPPAAPSGLRATVSGADVTLNWNAPPGSVSDYFLDVGYSPGATAGTLDLHSTATSFEGTGVPGNTYFLRVRAKNDCGTSAPSNEVVAILSNPGLPTLRDHTTTNATPASGCTTPARVSAFRTTNAGVWSWTLVSGAHVGDTVQWSWFKPDGSHYFTDDYQLTFSGDVCFWAEMYIAGHVPSGLPGSWSVRVLYNGAILLTEKFTISQ